MRTILETEFMKFAEYQTPEMNN